MTKKFASSGMRILTLKLLLVCCFSSSTFASESMLDQGLRDCASGNYNQALSLLQTSYAKAEKNGDKVKAASALAQSYMQMHQAAKAETYLSFAFDKADDKLDKAGYAIDFGNWQQQQGHAEQAAYYYDAALKLAGDNASIAISAGLNRHKLTAKKMPPAEQVKNLQALWQRLLQLKDAPQAARYSLNLGVQARSLGKAGLALAFQAFEHARVLSLAPGQARLQLEALDQLAQMYEDAGRFDDVLSLTDQALLAAQGVEAHDLLINIEWRHARILRAQANNVGAIAAYQRALEHIETIRVDIPVEYQDGRSSFRETLEPVYLGLADLLLQTSVQLEGVQKNAQLRRARDVLELLKQTELQDYLGDRCAVETARANRKSTQLASDTAILYPIILPDRLELLLETSSGMYRQSLPMSATKLRADVIDFGNTLKDNLSFQSQAKRLYQALLTPVDAELTQQGIHTLVIVPDGVLRLLPFAALHDGQRFAIEKYAIAVVPALSLTNTNARAHHDAAFKTLLAGMSEPGTVVDKLPNAMVEQLLNANQQASSMNGRQVARAVLTRSLRNIPKTADSSMSGKLSELSISKPEQHQQLQQMLALAGVNEEIHTLEKLTSSQTLLNAGFTVAAFSQKVKTGDYQIVHIASHGVFGGTADTTFVMAHDDVITMDNLQLFLRAGSMKSQELELLTLSACETAEGDDRAPLGLSGAALKARAKSALGSLWPVSDDAATLLMGQFYRNLAEPATSKAQALQKAQLTLMKNSNFNHPFYWAPFIMVGSWL
ncbi:CHAT domain-containing protein [Undibacterium sp. Di27W]|uniref:CHAT domain-containing protein n=1 Tax=Undibacterium sp. Di27W TaxID=3413036 RepID=UPI003BF2FA15